MENTILFDKEEKVKEVTLEQLKQTASLVYADGKLPKSRPIEHHALFDQISDMLTQADQPHVIEPIIVSKTESRKNPIDDPDNEGLLRSWLFRRLIGKITLTGDVYEDEESKSAIAISYDPLGISLAFGQNVNICSNLSIFGERFACTWGKQKYSTSFKNIISVIQQWISERKKIRQEDVEIFNRLKDIQVEKVKAMAELIGKMMMTACDMEARKEDFLTISDTSMFTQKFIKEHGNSDQMVSGWDIYNIGTHILTHSTSNITNKLGRINTFGGFITKELLQ